MPWTWVENGNGPRRRTRRRNRRNYRRSYDYDRPDYGMSGGNGYGDDNEEYSPPDDYYDNDVRLVITRGNAVTATPGDMLPPYANGGDYTRLRRRARF